jgi:hypothetical protein
VSNFTVGSTAPSADMTLVRGVTHAVNEEQKDLLYTLARRVAAIKPWQDRLREWCDRADALYFAEDFTDGGADLWSDDESAKVNGRIHISVNSPSAYVDIPAALQAVPPIENMLATDNKTAARARQPAGTPVHRVEAGRGLRPQVPQGQHGQGPVRPDGRARVLGQGRGRRQRPRLRARLSSSPGTSTSASRPTTTRKSSGPRT